MKRYIGILLLSFFMQGFVIANNEETNDGMGGRGSGSIYAPSSSRR